MRLGVEDEGVPDELVQRLNKLIEDEKVRVVLEKLLEHHIQTVELDDHPTVQVTEEGVGLLGILNGLCGVIPTGFALQGQGYISAVYDETGGPLRLISFELTTKQR